MRDTAYMRHTIGVNRYISEEEMINEPGQDEGKGNK